MGQANMQRHKEHDMIYSSATVTVNPTGETPLTREQLWAGLVLKARDARQFLPPGLCTKCDVVAEGPNYIIRDAVIMNDELVEFISFVPLKKVSFHQVKGPREGVIVNEIFEDETGALHVKFYAYLGLLDHPPGSEREQQAQAMMDSPERGYKAALLSTLSRTRNLVSTGKL